MYADDELLPLSGLQHIAYCERQWALIHLEQVWDESYDTVRGSLFHERVHLEGYSAAKGVRSERGYRLVSCNLGISGIADVVEFIADGDTSEALVRPVEYKVGKPKIEEWDRIQVCAQAICLEEMLGCAVGQGDLFYGATRHRERVVLPMAVCASASPRWLAACTSCSSAARRPWRCAGRSAVDALWSTSAFQRRSAMMPHRTGRRPGFEEASQHALRDES